MSAVTFGCYADDMKKWIYMFLELAICMALMFTSNDGKTRQSIRLIVFVCCFAFFCGGISRPLVIAVWDIDPSLVVNVLLGSIAMFVCLTFSVLCAPSNVYSCSLFILLLSHLVLVISILFMNISYLLQIYCYTMSLCFVLILDICESIMKIRRGDNDYILHCFHIFCHFKEFVEQVLCIKLIKKNKKKL